MITCYFLILVMTLMGSIASVFLKYASKSSNSLSLVKDKNLYIGGVLYVLAALINIYVLRYLDYSVVLPLTSITYIWTMIFSRFLLKEDVSLRKIFGVFFILVGAVLVSVH